MNSDNEPAAKKTKVTGFGFYSLKKEDGGDDDDDLQLGGGFGGKRAYAMFHPDGYDLPSYIITASVFLPSDPSTEPRDLQGCLGRMSLSPGTPQELNTEPCSVSGTLAPRAPCDESTQAPKPVPEAACPVRKRIPPPVDFVEPSFDDVFFYGAKDPASPTCPPRINPFSDGYYLGDIYF